MNLQHVRASGVSVRALLLRATSDRQRENGAMARTPPPLSSFPELAAWEAVGMHDPVFRARNRGGKTLYVRADDGSASLLRRFAAEPDVPAPLVVEERDGWLVLESLAGVPLHDRRWLKRPRDAVRIIADALLLLSAKDITHGDMCLPNILGELTTGRLSGIVDWRYGGRFNREIDVASAIWSCGFNGYSPEVPRAVLRAISWPRSDAIEVERLSAAWLELAGPPDVDSKDPHPHGLDRRSFAAIPCPAAAPREEREPP